MEGYGITTDDQLRELATKMGVKLNYIGFAEDLSKKAPTGFNIINLGGPETRGMGTHWVLWYVGPHESAYFDSYGAPPEDPIIKLTPNTLWVNGKQLQGYNEDYCGIWAITAASHLNKAKDIKKALTSFIDSYDEVK
jgi:hypothetical protein